jgi:hypothetical protein
MLQKTTDEALRAEDDLAEAIDLIWMLDAAVRGFDFDPDTPNGRAAAGMASTFELVVEKLKGVSEPTRRHIAPVDADLTRAVGQEPSASASL